MKLLLRVEIEEKLTKKNFFLFFFWRFWNFKTELFLKFLVFHKKKYFFVIEMRYWPQENILRFIESTQKNYSKNFTPPPPHTQECLCVRDWNLTLDWVGQIFLMVVGWRTKEIGWRIGLVEGLDKKSGEGQCGRRIIIYGLFFRHIICPPLCPILRPKLCPFFCLSSSKVLSAPQSRTLVFFVQFLMFFAGYWM